MKRQILTTALLALICTGAYAQRDKVKIQDTQARLLDVTSNALSLIHISEPTRR